MARIQRAYEAGRLPPSVGHDQESEAARQIVQALGPGTNPILHLNLGGNIEDALQECIARLRDRLRKYDPEIQGILLSAAMALYTVEGGDIS
eukprot:7410464-Alexandrium_andersonii.AAC.1